jgi:integrase
MPRTNAGPSAFLDPGAPTLATVIDQLAAAEPDLRRRGEMTSGVRTLCRVLGRLPRELPADTALLNRLMRGALPAAVGVTSARWANVRSLVLRAMNLTGCRIMPGRRLHPMVPVWAALAERLPDHFARTVLSRLMRWCSAEGIAPEDVDQTVIERFGRILCEDSFHGHPLDVWQRTVGGWNRAVGTIPGWPQVRLEPPPPAREAYVLPLTAFPVTFQADVALWLDRLAGKAGLDVGPVRPLRPVTIAKWHFAVRQLASARVLSGRQPATLTSLADLVTPEAAATILGFFLERVGNRPCAQTHGLAARLKAIAEHHVGVMPAVLVQLQRMAQRVTPPVQGMTDKNRNTLRQFADPAMQRRLINLPGEMFARLLTSGVPPKQLALRLQAALAVEILLVAPMRLKNLAALKFDWHLRCSGNGRNARWFVVIPGVEVKNGEPLELPLPERTVRLLETYRARVLPVLAERPGAMWLFPGVHGSKREVTLGPQIGKLIRRELGCRLSPHQFRHLCGYLYLQRHPHGHEVVRAMLGHRSIETTIKFYAGLEGIAAARHYDAMLQELITPAPRPRRRA